MKRKKYEQNNPQTSSRIISNRAPTSVVRYEVGKKGDRL